MKWLQFFRKRKKLNKGDGEGDGRSDEEEEDEEEDNEQNPSEHLPTGAEPLPPRQDSKRRGQQQHHPPTKNEEPRPRASLDTWFEARRARTRADVSSTTTTEQLTVTKAGITTLINRTYIVIKHLGSGTYGQVKLAFNLRDRKLYAIKLCRKSQYGAAMAAAGGAAFNSPRQTSLGRARRSAMGAHGGVSSRSASSTQLLQGLGSQKGSLSGGLGGGRPSASQATGGSSGAGPAAGGFARPASEQQLLPPVPEGQREGRSGNGAFVPAAPAPPPFTAPAPAVRQLFNAGVGDAPAPAPAVFRRPPTWSASTTQVQPSATRLARVSDASGSPAQPHPTAPFGGGDGAQVGAQRLGPASTPAFRYSSAAIGLGGGPMMPGGWGAGGERGRGLGASSIGGGGESGVPLFAGEAAVKQVWRSRSNPGIAAFGEGQQRTPAREGATPIRAPAASAPTPFLAASADGGGNKMGARTSTGSADGITSAAVASQRRRAEEWIREIAIMKKLTHPNIVRLVEVIDDPGSDNLLLVMEYVEGVSLHPRRLDSAHWAAVPEHEAWRRARDVLQGLDYLHFHGVVHGDLKPANLMLDTNTRQVKIVDFGSAAISQSGSGVGLGGLGMLAGGAMSCTPAFRSPESLQSGYRPSFELDIWALGVTVYLWVFGSLPFNGAAPFLIYECIRRKDLALPPDSEIRSSAQLKDFLRAVLEKDPGKRLDVVGALTHPWVTGDNKVPLPIIQRLGSGEAAGSGDGEGDADMDATVTADQEVASGGPSTACSGGAQQRRSTSGRKRLRYSSVRLLSQEELDQAISRSQGEAAISELMGMVFEEVRLPPSTTFIRAGDPVDTIYMITQGETEIYQELPPDQAAVAALLLGIAAPERAGGHAAAPYPDPPDHLHAGPEVAPLAHGRPDSGPQAAAAGLSGAQSSGQLPLLASQLSPDGHRARSVTTLMDGLMVCEAAGVPGGFQAPHTLLPADAAQPPALQVASVPQRGGREAAMRVASPSHGCWLEAIGSGGGAAADTGSLSLPLPLLTEPSPPTSLPSLSDGTGVGVMQRVPSQPRALHEAATTSARAPLCSAQLGLLQLQPATMLTSLSAGTPPIGLMAPAAITAHGGMHDAAADCSMGGTATALVAPTPPPSRSSILSAAVASLAQPIISGLSPSQARNLLAGGMRPLRALVSAAIGADLPTLSTDGLSMDVDEDELSGPDSYMDALVASLAQAKTDGSTPFFDAAMPPPITSPGASAGGAPRSRPSLLLQRSGSLGLSTRQGGSASVIVLAVKGPGDTLGLASLEPSVGTEARATPPDRKRTGSGAHSAGPGDAAVAAPPTVQPSSMARCLPANGLLLPVGLRTTGSSSPLTAGGSAMASSQPQPPGHEGMAQHEGDDTLMSSDAEADAALPLHSHSPRAAFSSAGDAAAGQPPAAAGGPTWRANVRTRDVEVVAFRAKLSHIHRLINEHPELAAAMKHIAVQQETDLLVSEALRQLRLVSACTPVHHTPAPPLAPPAPAPHAAPRPPPGGARLSEGSAPGASPGFGFLAPGASTFLLQQRVN